MAVVGLIDENRLWFKSVQGISAHGGQRLHSFCDASLRLPRPTLMVVPDTLQARQGQGGRRGTPHSAAAPSWQCRRRVATAAEGSY